MKKSIWLPIIIVIIIILILWFDQSSIKENISSTHPEIFKKKHNWLKINYESLVDKNIITHNGETVGEIINKIPNYTDDIKGLVQPYLEPYSILCHDILLTTIDPDTIPFINIIDHYSMDSEQPVWAALFREGHYQIYYNKNTIRVFLKGDNQKHAFKREKSVIRHALLDIIYSQNKSIQDIEIYVFKNDYSSMQISLNTIPEIIDVNNLDLSADKEPLDLTSLEDFFNNNIEIKAIEVDHGNLRLYGKEGGKQSIAGYQMSLSDFAVIYRSIFHCGNNTPYISLDKHEDNRYAKVNFGGHFENTHVGKVVLEADKLFKTLSTGIDPNTHENIESEIIEYVPSFLTEDERSILNFSNKGRMRIRYWFYPDSITMITDGNIGVNTNNQFFADIERMDIETDPSYAVKKTIEHLNKHYYLYERAFNTYKELSTVGNLMSLVNWLKSLSFNKKVELDDLLSVRIPAYNTPKKTKKMLAVTACIYPHTIRLNKYNLRNYAHTFYLSHLLDDYSPTTEDIKFLDGASDYFSNLDLDDYNTEEYTVLKNDLNFLSKLIDKNELELEFLLKEINNNKSSLNTYNPSNVSNYNKKVDKYNSLLDTQESLIDSYNEKIKAINKLTISANHIASVGGGIDLDLSKSMKIDHRSFSNKINEIDRVKNNFKVVGKVLKADNWISNKLNKINQRRLNLFTPYSWTVNKESGKDIRYSYTTVNDNFLNLSIYHNNTGWETEKSILGNYSNVHYNKSNNTINIFHENSIEECHGKFSDDRKRISLYYSK